MADEPVEGCGCARCANAALRKVSAERDSLKAQLELAEAFHDVAVKERDFYNIRLLAHERVVEAARALRDEVRWLDESHEVVMARFDDALTALHGKES